MQVMMLETIEGKKFSFVKGRKYKALDGDETGVKELCGKILVRQPNSPKKKDWWCMFDKSFIGKRLIFEGGLGGGDKDN